MECSPISTCCIFICCLSLFLFLLYLTIGWSLRSYWNLMFIITVTSSDTEHGLYSLTPFFFFFWPIDVLCVEYWHCTGFPGGSVVKNPPVSAGDPSLISELGRSPGEGNGNPLQYFCLGNPTDRGTLQATVHRVTKSLNGLTTKPLYMYMCNWVTLLYSSNYHNIVIQVYFNKKNFN